MRRDGQGGGLGEVHRVGDDVGVDRRGGDVLSMAAVQVNAEALLVAAPLVVAHSAVLAVAAGDAVVQYDPVTDLQRGMGRGADGRHFPGNVAAHDPGQRAVVGASFPQVEVQVVQGAAPDPEHYFAGADLRLGPVSVYQLVRAAVFVDKDRFHRSPSVK